MQKDSNLKEPADISKERLEDSEDTQPDSALPELWLCAEVSHIPTGWSSEMTKGRMEETAKRKVC